MSDRRRRFAAAFYAQARSDWDVYQRLTEVDDVPRCHQPTPMLSSSVTI